MVSQKRVAIYAWAATLDAGQNLETERVTLRAYAARRGFDAAGEYVEDAGDTQEDRPQYRALLAAAKARQIDVILVWCYDRFARSTQALVRALKVFHSFGVDFIAYQENIDTTTPQGALIFTVMDSIARFEQSLTSARVKAGMARAKAQGKRISRPPLPKPLQNRIAVLHAEGCSIQQISEQLSVSYGTAWNYVQRCKGAATGGRSLSEA